MGLLSIKGATISATPSTFASAFAAAAGGDVIALAPGNYGSFTGGSKISMVTIQPNVAAGGTRANVTFGPLNLGSSQNITLQNLTAAGATVGTGSVAALHIHLIGITFTDSVCIYTPQNLNQDTLIDSSTFANLGQSCTEGRLGIAGTNSTHTVNNGVVIQNNVFGPGGCADGIQINGSATGTQILKNEFTGLKQGSCSPVHVDPIQFYGAKNTTVSGNYFHGNSTGIMTPDCNGTPMTVTGNVFVTDGEYPDQIMVGGGNGDVFNHNTFAGGADIRFGNPNSCGLNANATVTNNVFTGKPNLTNGQTTSSFRMDYNLISGGGVGAHTITGLPTFVGGPSPTSLGGFVLTASSLGHLAASDGTDIGFAAVASTQPPPNPPANINPPTDLSASVQ